MVSSSISFNLSYLIIIKCLFENNESIERIDFYIKNLIKKCSWLFEGANFAFIYRNQYQYYIRTFYPTIEHDRHRHREREKEALGIIMHS
jgi:hypothetical protein